MNKRNISLLSVFIILTLLGIYYIFASKPAEITLALAAAKPTPYTVSKPDVSANDLTSTQSVNTQINAHLGPSASMYDAFNKTQNYAAFIADALNRPAEGGRFYAYVAFNRCQEVMPFVLINPQQKDKALSSKQQNAIQAIRDLQERCKNVATQFPDALSFSRAVMDNRGEKDPTFSVYNRLTDSNKVTEDVHRKDLTRALAGGDKYDIITALELGKDSFAKEFSNKYGQKLPENIVDSAFSAVACELAQTCMTSLWVLGTCATTGNCKIMNRSEQLRAELSGKQLELFDRLKRDLSEMFTRT
jgi:hypothetical protein